MECLCSLRTSVNEQTRDGNKLCSPYRIIVYNDTDSGVDTSSVIYDSDNDNNHDPNSNRFTLSLDRKLCSNNY